MKITNLRPKDGASVILDKDGHAVLFDSDGHVVGTLAEGFDMEHLDYDVVQPEYKVGDVVKIENSGETRKGFICRESDALISVCVASTTKDRPDDGLVWGFRKDNLQFKSGFGYWKVVGLWLESGETK